MSFDLASRLDQAKREVLLDGWWHLRAVKTDSAYVATVIRNDVYQPGANREPPVPLSSVQTDTLYSTLKDIVCAIMDRAGVLGLTSVSLCRPLRPDLIRGIPVNASATGDRPKA